MAKRIKELAENDRIKVINNRYKISEATRQVVNSIIQGSAADLTKLAMLKVENDEEWKRLGGRILVPVHDELIAEVPIENWKEGGERLSQLMCEAANFLPFSIKCDVTTTYRWYGLEYPCPYKQPESIQNLADESEINWVLYAPCVECIHGSEPRCAEDWTWKWKHAEEVLKLLGGNEK